MRRISFMVYGLPRTAGSKRAFPSKSGRIIVTDDSGAKGKRWRENVAAAAGKTMGRKTLLGGPLRLELEFRLPRPKGHYGTGKNAKRLRAGAPQYPTTKPDLTKMLRAAEDAMTGIVWRDDAQIVDQFCRKRYVEISCGVEVTVEEMPDDVPL